MQTTTAHSLPAILLTLTLALGFGGCAQGPVESGSEPSDTAAGAQADSGTAYPDVTAVEIVQDGQTFTVDVTISSPYDSPERYADGWRVLDEEGEVLGEMELAHDHASEQPFTRSQTGLAIPEDVTTVTVEGRDSENGYGGATVEATVPGH